MLTNTALHGCGRAADYTRLVPNVKFTVGFRYDAPPFSRVQVLRKELRTTRAPHVEVAVETAFRLGLANTRACARSAEEPSVTAVEGHLADGRVTSSSTSQLLHDEQMNKHGHDHTIEVLRASSGPVNCELAVTTGT